ncbi:nucleolar DEAD-box protein required for synthesis of 60S ribosomal subunit, partial [Cladochytrium tenue]
MGNKARGAVRPRPAKASATAATKAATVAKTTVAPKTSSRAADTTPADVAVAGDDAVPFDPLAIGTIDDDGQVPVVYEPDDDDDGGSVPLRTKGASKPGAKSELNPSFTFEIDGGDVGRLGPPKSWDFTTAKEALRASMAARARPGVSELSSIDAKIARKKREMKEEISSSAKRVRKGDAGEDGEDSGDESEANGESDELGSAKGLEEDAGSDASDEEGREDAEDAESEDDPAEDDFSGAEEDEEGTMARAVADDDEDVDDIVHDRRKAEYFAEEPSVTSSDGPQSFTDMRLSRPVLKAIADMGFVKPTAIQARSIPLALQGLDICGAAMTGSGKTGAFIVPVLERLLYRPKNVPATRVLVLVPTRELGVQCHSVATNLAKYTDIQLCLCVGGLSNKLQEAELKKRPDVVIATPGRLIDHIHNSMSFNLESIEILIIDEADRILEDGFADELNEIIKSTPKTRQTMLFSATMTDNVDDLIRLSLNRPVRLFVDKTNTLTNRLVQEFVRVRSTKEESRAAMLIALCQRTYTSQAIVFFRSKAAAHQMKIVFGLCGLLAAELHGNLTQLQRLEALESFRDGKVNFLLATDLAARGLDISGVKTVINFDMPRSYAQYVHRVGRTARAERAGRAVSFVGEADRKVLKLALKGSHDAVKSR